MLAFRPDTVRMSEARDFVSSAVSIEKDFKRLRMTPPIDWSARSSACMPSYACTANTSGRSVYWRWYALTKVLFSGLSRSA